ncbi:hypothetical protein DFP72DRAFT_1166965 [Ephemerocybe angulata]|uniref:Uncharacterized protein n=1 Tax=Ephemerocybe angulata TaxID=980116 RepID=A0A8H6MD20_9AGAR|nr:hypothetical protein DFP72DRAFT_1173825 [Tulosesus angulatus]KAF6759587.1 hypothetical protein DFP72DRAFT_1166965 [Tulosesus angulatus]
MRVSLFAILPIALALASTVTAYYDDDFEARDYIDGVATREYGLNDILGARDLLVEISTRDIVKELKRREEFHVPKPKPKYRYRCMCDTPILSNEAEAQAHRNKGHRVVKEVVRPSKI